MLTTIAMRDRDPVTLEKVAPSIAVDLSPLATALASIEEIYKAYADLNEKYSELVLAYHDDDATTEVAQVQAILSQVEQFAPVFAQYSNAITQLRDHVQSAVDAVRDSIDQVDHALFARIDELEGGEFMGPDDMVADAEAEMADMRQWISENN